MHNVSVLEGDLQKIATEYLIYTTTYSVVRLGKTASKREILFPATFLYIIQSDKNKINIAQYKNQPAVSIKKNANLLTGT